ncbi:5'-methylthioadenosine/adenosylhomocysteine nucleosidase [Bombilactobacillus folatiphilus]|uniref:adenosylhomocysteine nucleosidase n=1 Tax=Bombilactobacillus folatiphilus TaxID=2923362 RepID=A0ABY4PB27_9LACO|nr:5'-methylthioadenosine/adenosylhomocysteine nucleosidase [Bombilactobacillus folatiphilus]UQS82716.1 5'-methylthioadenosine/adenosylhomocysteine nucleosidase [Bombilactobacillus folatiphilus]
MKIGVIVPMEEELGLLTNSLNNVSCEQIAGIKLWLGCYKNHQVVVAQCGIGKVQAAMVTTLLCSNYQIDILINTGSAGGIGEGLNVGDVVVSKQVAYHDVDVTASDYPKGQLPQQPLYFKADDRLVEQIVDAGHTVGQDSKVGLIVSGDQFIGSQQQKQQILADFPDALTVEMEGAAVGQVATQFSIPFVIIRSMSDVGDDQASVSFDEFVRDAGERSVQMLLNFMDHN